MSQALLRGRATSSLIFCAAIAIAGATHAAPGAPSASAPAASAPPVSAPGAAPWGSAKVAPATDPQPMPAAPAAPVMPGMGGEPEGDPRMPPGHPATGGPGAPGGQENPNLPRIPRDSSGPASSVPASTIDAVVLDENDKPVANVPVTLWLLRQSVAQGDSRTTKTATSDANGFVRFSGLLTTSDWSYQIKVQAQGESNATATYGSPAFNLMGNTGWMVRIHRFPVTTRFEDLIAGFEFVVASLDIREDAIEVAMEFNLVNLSPKAWGLGAGLDLALPTGFKGLRAAETMDDLKVEPIEGKGARWTGAFPPGQWTIQYDFKLPYDGEAAYDVDLPMPARVLNAAVRVAGRKGTVVRVDGFDAPKEDIAPNGARFLTAMKRGDPNNPVTRLSIHVSGLPEPGPEKWAAILVGLGGLLAGIYALARVSPESAAPAPIRKRMRARLLEDVVALEKAHRAGEVGPKGYATERARLLTAIADTLLEGYAPEAKAKGKPKATVDED